MGETDAQLVHEAQEQPFVFDKLYRKYYKQVYKYIWFRVGFNSEAAEDLLQECFLRAFEHLKDFHASGFSYLTYLLTIAHNLVVNQYRKQPTISLDTDDAPEIADSRATMQTDLEAQEIIEATEDLPESERSVIHMFYEETLPVAIIAERLGKTANAVKLLLSRARKHLKQHPRLTGLAQT